MKIHIFGDIGGHYYPFLTALEKLGVDIETAMVPKDVAIIQVGDLVHRGPDSEKLVAWVDEALRQNHGRFGNGRWVQLFGNHEGHHLGGSLRTDQRVATPRGWRKIGELCVGDQVFGPEGLPATVTGVYPQGVLDLWRVTTNDGAQVVCDGNHLWTVLDRKGRCRTLTLNQIMKEGFTSPNGKKKNGDIRTLAKHRVPITSPLSLEEVSLPIDPYLLGSLLGDGSMTDGSPTVTSKFRDEKPWLECLPEDILAKNVENRDGVCYGTYVLSAGLRGVSKFNPITASLRDLGLWGKKFDSKFIPEPYLWSSFEQRWALLQGLLDTDGSAVPSAGGAAEFSTGSKVLAENVTQLVQSLGGVARTEIREPSGKAKSVNYRLYVSLPHQDPPFRLKRKVDRWHPRLSPRVRSIRDVERVLDGEAVCIKVDRDDGLFLTEGMIVTHNTKFSQSVKGETLEWELGQEAEQTLKRWWSSQKAFMAVAIHRTDTDRDVLVSHAGLTRQTWDGLTAPDDVAFAADALNSQPVRNSFAPGWLLGGYYQAREGSVMPPSVAWASAAKEVYPSWENRPCPFDQVHGHSAVWSWRNNQSYLEYSMAARLERDHERRFTRWENQDGTFFYCVDQGLQTETPRFPLASLAMEGEILVPR